MSVYRIQVTTGSKSIDFEFDNERDGWTVASIHPGAGQELTAADIPWNAEAIQALHALTALHERTFR